MDLDRTCVQRRRSLKSGGLVGFWYGLWHVCLWGRKMEAGIIYHGEVLGGFRRTTMISV